MKLEPTALTVVSTWEAVALLTHRLPTVTQLVLGLPRAARVGLVVGTAGWLAAHFAIMASQEVPPH